MPIRVRFAPVLGKLRYLPPNLSTAASMIIGLWSIHASLHGRLEEAAWCILWSVLLDKLDGTLARLFKAQSAFGVEFDSFADFCAFGLAPAALAIQAVVRREPAPSNLAHGLLLGAGALYVVLTAARLARYNARAGTADPAVFRGLTSTLSGALLASGWLVAHRHLPALAPETAALAAVLALLGLGALMLTSFPLPKLRPRRARWFHWFQIGNIAAAYLLTALRLLPEYTFALAVLYAAVGFALGRRSVTLPAGEETVRPGHA